MSASDDGWELEGSGPTSEPRKLTKAGRRPKLKVIEEPQDVAPDAALVMPADGLVLIPTSTEMIERLEAVTDLDEAKKLHDLAALWERYAKAFDEMFGAAEVRIRLEIQMGRLAQLMSGTAHGPQLHNVTGNGAEAASGASRAVSARMRSRYRRMAGIPDDVVSAYFDERKQEGRMPSSNALLKRAANPQAVRKPGKWSKKPRPHRPDIQMAMGPSTERDVLPAFVIDAVKRVLKVEVVVGGDPKAFPKTKTVKADTLQWKHLHGDVFVAECLEPAAWLPQLVEARSKQGVVQVLVLLPASTGAPWFKCLEQGKWACCFLREAPLAVVYQGDKRRGFWGAFHDLGTLMLAGVPVECTY